MNCGVLHFHGHPLLLLLADGNHSITWFSSQLISFRWQCSNHIEWHVTFPVTSRVAAPPSNVETRRIRHSQECKNPRWGKPSIQRQADTRKWHRENPVSLALLCVGALQQGNPSVVYICSSSGNIAFCLKTNPDVATFWPKINGFRGTLLSQVWWSQLHRVFWYHLEKQTYSDDNPTQVSAIGVVNRGLAFNSHLCSCWQTVSFQV